MDEHEKWLSRRAFHETFSSPGTVFPKWRGKSNRCECGCGGVWNDRLSTTNWWTMFNPADYVSNARGLFRFFHNLHRVLWHLPSMIWLWFRTIRGGYKREVMNRVQPGLSPAVALGTARLLLFGFIAPLTAIGWATVWILARPGVLLIVGLFLLTLALLLAVFSISVAIAMVAISMSGIVFILGGVGSILYLDNPVFGILAILVGVFIQYEFQRREGKRREEQLGYLIRRLESPSRLGE